MKEYNLKQLCAEKLGVKPPAFRKNSEKYLNELKKSYHVEIIKGPKSNSPTIYRLTLKNENEMPSVLLENNNEVKLTKNSEEQIELLLKAVLIDGVVPVHKELARIIGKHKNTVGNRVSEMKKLGILLPIPTEKVIERDEDTGYVINEYERKICYWYYYDNLLSGNIKKVIDTTEVHHFYAKYFNQKITYLKAKHGKKYDGALGSGKADKYAKEMLNKDFGFHDINRIEEWIVSKEYEMKILNKYHRQVV